MSDRQQRERRESSFGGTWNRTQFELSLKSIGTFGFSRQVMDYCRARARATGSLPHQVAIGIVEEAVLLATRGYLS
jgi:hypothetical protein